MTELKNYLELRNYINEMIISGSHCCDNAYKYFVVVNKEHYKILDDSATNPEAGHQLCGVKILRGKDNTSPPELRGRLSWEKSTYSDRASTSYYLSLVLLGFVVGVVITLICVQ